MYRSKWKIIGLMQKSPPIFKKMFLNDVALLWMRAFHAYDTGSVSSENDTDKCPSSLTLRIQICQRFLLIFDIAFSMSSS